MCSGSTALSVVVNTESVGGNSLGRNYKWQISEKTDCAAVLDADWKDVVGATSSSFVHASIAGTRLYRCLITANCTADFNTKTIASDCARVTYQPYNSASGTATSPATPYYLGDPAPPIQSGICGSTVLPGSVHALNTLQPPAVDAMANISSYAWSKFPATTDGGTLASSSGSSNSWTAPALPGSVTITLEYQDACPAANQSVTCDVQVGSSDCDFVYVSPTGSNTGGISGGGPSNPYLTLGYALSNLDERLHVRMENGFYSEASIL